MSVTERERPQTHPEMTDRERVTISDEVMRPEGCVIRAIFDPGLFTRRRHGEDEPLHRWQARAVLVALEMAGHSVVDANAR